jgi:large subunit ribosomal protein L25
MTTTTQTLAAKPRQAAGKGAARRLRQGGLVPAIAYGKGLPATAIAVGPKEVAAILRSELGKNTLIELDLDGKKLLAMIKDFTVHPLARSLEHVDFVEVKLDHPVDVEVPLVATGKAVGVAKGGVLRIVHRMVPVRCLPNLVPVKITTDVTHLELGEHIATQDLKLPEGVVVRLAPTQTLVAVVAPEKEVEEVPAPGAVAAVAAAGAAAPAAAGAAAPAADAKKDDKKEDKKK